MRTYLTREQLQAVIDQHFDCDINFVMWDVAPGGTFQGVVVDSRFGIDAADLDEAPSENNGFVPIVPGEAKDDGTGRASAYDTSWPDVHTGGTER